MREKTPKNGRYLPSTDPGHIAFDLFEDEDDKDTSIISYEDIKKITLNEARIEKLIEKFDKDFFEILHSRESHPEAFYRRCIIHTLLTEGVVCKKQIHDVLEKRMHDIKKKQIHSDRLSIFYPPILEDAFIEIYRLNQEIAVHEENA